MHFKAECERLRNDLVEVQGQAALDVSNLKKALDDLRFQNEDNLNTINVRNQENAELSQQML